MKKLLLVLTILLSANSAFAQQKASNVSQDMVVATVNEQAITLQELKNRITLTKMLMSKELSESEFNYIKQQAMEQLITEEIKRQYATEQGLDIGFQELGNAIRYIENQRGIAENTLLNTIPKELKNTALAQIKDSILQQKIIQHSVLSDINIPEYEIDNLLENALNQANTKEYKISRILVEESEKPSQDSRKISKIYEKLNEGEDFKDLVLAFSDGPNKIQGGTLGWFNISELRFDMQKAVSGLQKGEFSKPIKSAEGWYIVKLEDLKVIENIDTSRNNEYKIISFKTDKIEKDKFKEMKKEIDAIRGYSDFVKFQKSSEDKYGIKTIKYEGWVRDENLSDETIAQIKDTLPSNFTEIELGEENSLEFSYVLDKQVVRSKQVDAIRARIEQNLQSRKAERKFKQLMKDLKQNAFVEIR